MIETLTLADLCQSRGPLVLAPDDPVALALGIMGERRLSAVVVATAGYPVGIFTERDALDLLARGDYDPETRLRDLMSPDPITASPHLSFVDGYTRMAGHGFRHLVLVDAQGRLFGVISESDFAHALGAEELMGPRTVADLMTRDPATLPPEASVAAALALMAERAISSVVIAAAGRALGILSERDAIRFAGADLDLRTTPLRAQMSRPLHRIGPDRPAHEASPMMRALGVRRLVVEDASGQLVGILTRRDLLRDIQDVYVRLLRRVVADQGRALQDARRQLSEQSVLHSLLGHAQDLGIVAADAAQVVQFVNGAALEALGLSAEAARSLPLSGLLAAAGLTAQGYTERFAALRGSERLSLDLRRTTGAGARWLRLVASAIRDQAGGHVGFLLTVEDRTQEYDDAARQRATEDALRAEQGRLNAERARLANIIAGTRVGTWEWEVQTGVTVFNERWAEIAGYRLEDLAPTSIETWVRLAHPKDLQTSNALLERHFRRELDTYECEVRIRHRDGHWVWVFDQGRVVSWGPRGEPLLMSGIHQDVSERHLAEERLRESEARLSAVFDNAPLGMALAGSDGRVSLANRALGAFLGCDPELLVGKPVYGMSPPRERRQDRAILADLLAGRRESYRATKRYRRLDGREVWGDLRVALLPNRSGEPPSPLGMVEDVTELHAANAQRRALEETLGRYTAQLEELVDLVNLPLAPPAQVQALLGLGCRSLGMEAAVLQALDDSQGVLATVRADDPQGPLPCLARPVLETFLEARGQPRVLGSEALPEATLAAGFASCIGLAFDCPCPDGRQDTLLLTLWSTEPALGLGGPEQQILRLIAQRVTALRHEEQIQRDLVQARERETIGHLASGVAHDFNNLLGAIGANLGYLETRRHGRLSDPDIAQVLEEIQSALGQATVVTTGMLALNRAGGVPLESVELASTVAQLVRILVQLLPPSIRLRVEVPPGLVAHSNRGFLQAALLNLALNARDAMPEGGDLRISARPGRWAGSERPAVGQVPAGSGLDLSVTDTGCGMGPEVLAHIFEPLFSTKAKQRGHGLGLFMVQEFVSRSGAGLTVSSRPGQGTRFSLLLPAADLAKSGET